MLAHIEVQRDGDGRLVGTLEYPDSVRRVFTGLMELVGLIDQGLEAQAPHTGSAGSGPERGTEPSGDPGGAPE